MIRRPRRSIPASVVALVVLAAAVLVVVSCVQVLLATTPPLLPFGALAGIGSTVTTASPAVVTVAVVAAVVGLLLLASALLPGAPTVVAVGDAPGDPRDDRAGSAIATGITRRSLDRALGHTAVGVDGVDHAAVTTGRRRVRAAVRTTAQDTAALKAAVAAALSERLTDLSPDRAARVRVTVSTTSRSA